MAQDPADRGLDPRIEVNGIDYFHILILLSDHSQAMADLLESLKRLPPMAGHQDQPFPLELEPIVRGEFSLESVLNLKLFLPLGCPQEGVDYGIAGDEDLLFGDSLTEEILPRHFGRGKEEVGESVTQLAVGLLGKGREFIVSPQPCLDMADLDL